MKSYAVRAGYIPADKLTLFARIVEDFDNLPDLEPDDRVSCHSVARAMAMRHEQATCIDGWFKSVGHDHSWLDIGDGIIVDVYPIGGTMPFLVDASHWISPWHGLYIPHPTLLDEGGRNRNHHDSVAQELFDLMES